MVVAVEGNLASVAFGILTPPYPDAVLTVLHLGRHFVVGSGIGHAIDKRVSLAVERETTESFAVNVAPQVVLAVHYAASDILLNEFAFAVLIDEGLFQPTLVVVVVGQRFVATGLNPNGAEVVFEGNLELGCGRTESVSMIGDGAEFVIGNEEHLVFVAQEPQPLLTVLQREDDGLGLDIVGFLAACQRINQTELAVLTQEQVAVFQHFQLLDVGLEVQVEILQRGRVQVVTIHLIGGSQIDVFSDVGQKTDIGQVDEAGTGKDVCSFVGEHPFVAGIVQGDVVELRELERHPRREDFPRRFSVVHTLEEVLAVEGPGRSIVQTVDLRYFVPVGCQGVTIAVAVGVEEVAISAVSGNPEVAALGSEQSHNAVILNMDGVAGVGFVQTGMLAIEPHQSVQRAEPDIALVVLHELGDAGLRDLVHDGVALQAECALCPYACTTHAPQQEVT